MSSAPLPHFQQISGISARDDGQAFAGTVYGNVYYGDNGTVNVSNELHDLVFRTVELTLHLASASYVPPKPFSTVPFPRDPDFVDRDDVLAQIEQRCSRSAGRAAIVGLSGVG
jgi:hypothetical protein